MSDSRHAARGVQDRMGFIAGFLLCFSLAGCATVPKEETIRAGKGGKQVSPSLVNIPKHRLKRKVAIARFSNETTYGKSVLLDGKADLVARQASDVLSGRLAEAGPFLLFERSDTNRLLEALNRGDFSKLNLSADYLIVGSVSEFGRSTVGATGVFSRTKKQRAHARVNVRIIDVRTSRIIFSQEGEGEAYSEVGTVLGVGTKAGYDSSLNDKAISAAISKVVGNIVENLLDRPWRSYVLAVENGDVIIGGGKAQGIGNGEVFQVMERGKTIRNRQTGGLVELPGRFIAEIEVVSVFGDTVDSEASRCRVLTGSIPAEKLEKLIVVEKTK